MKEKIFSKAALEIDPRVEVDRISEYLRRVLRHDLSRRGLVVGLSGGIDSTVTLGLMVQAVGREKSFAVLMPEKDSDEQTLTFSRMAASHFGVECVMEDITPILDALGHYRRYIEAVRMVIPEYGEGWKSKITTSNVVSQPGFVFFTLVAQAPDQSGITCRLPLKPYLALIAAMNFKQRVRKTIEYYHADRLNFAVAGTPNRLEYELGFFVKQGDGAADVKPIAHLYKSQVYQLADYLNVPQEIISRKPTTDTFSLAQGQDEFYFALPYQQMDICLWARNHDIPAEHAAPVVGLSAAEVRNVYADIDRKRLATRYQHLPALLVDDISGVASPHGRKS